MTVSSHFFLFFVHFYSSIDFFFEQQQNKMKCSKAKKTTKNKPENYRRSFKGKVRAHVCLFFYLYKYWCFIE